MNEPQARVLDETLKEDLVIERRARKDLWAQIVGAVLIAICSGSLGFGYSQSNVNTSVIKLTTIIDNLKDAQERDRRDSTDRDNRIMADLQNQRTASTQHMNESIGLMTKLVDQNTSLILKMELGRGK